MGQLFSSWTRGHRGKSAEEDDCIDIKGTKVNLQLSIQMISCIPKVVPHSGHENFNFFLFPTKNPGKKGQTVSGSGLGDRQVHVHGQFLETLILGPRRQRTLENGVHV